MVHQVYPGFDCSLSRRRFVSVYPLNMSDSSLHDDIGDFDLSESSESYVNSVMASQTVLNSPVTEIFSKRKRHLSMPAVQDTVKKLRGVGSINNDLIEGVEREGAQTESSEQGQDLINISDKTENRKVVTAKKKLYKSQKKDSEVICTAASVHVDGDVSVKGMISQMNKTMHTLFESLSDKMKEMEHNIESKLVSKFNQQIDKRVNSESKKLKKEMESQLSSLRTDLCDDIAEINAKLNSLSDNFQSNQTSGQPVQDGQFQNMEKNIIIRNLPYTINEDLRGKVNGLFRDGLKMAEVVVDCVERKESRVESASGVVVVTLGSKEDKRNILRVKTRLNKNHRYKRVFIHPDLPKRERQLAANFRKVVNAVQNSDVKLFVKGSRVLSSRRSVDEDIPARDISHSRGRDFRHREMSHDYRQYECEDMDTCTSHSAQEDKRRENRRYGENSQNPSERQVRGKQRSATNGVNSRNDMSSNSGRSSANDLLSSGEPPADRRGSSSRMRHSSGDRYEESGRRSTFGGQSGQPSGRFRSDRNNYRHNDYNSRPYPK